MAINSAIEWTDASWNPVTGCTEISPGCDHCYAKTFAERWRGIPGHPYEQGFDLKLWPDRLELPLKWKKPRRIFVNSMSDLFHKDVPEEFIDRVFATMALTREHIYQVLTKRSKRMAAYLNNPEIENRIEEQIEKVCGDHLWCPPDFDWPLPNVWLGTSIESDAYTWRANYLRQAPAAVHFISAEPLLSALPSLSLNGIHWLIVGGESGHGARPMHPTWARSLRDQCATAGVAFFFKQWGEFAPRIVNPPVMTERGMEFPEKEIMTRFGKKAAGRLLDGAEWNQFPDEVPA